MNSVGAVCTGVFVGSTLALLLFLAFVWYKSAPDNRNRQFIADTNTAPTGARVRARTERVTEWLYWLPSGSDQVYRARLRAVQQHKCTEYEAVAWEDSAFADEPKPKLQRVARGVVIVEKVTPVLLNPARRTPLLNSPKEET